jgi:hypothetical protein
MTKRIFWDLDETLIHTLFASSHEKDADSFIDTYGEHWAHVKFCDDNHWYVTFLRKQTREWLVFSRQLTGNENVFMLTFGMNWYARKINDLLNLGFPEEQIFAREHIRDYEKHSPQFKDSYNILIDDREYFEHRGMGRHGKVNFLNSLPESQFINIEEFTVWNREDPDDYLDQLKNEIKECYEKI